MMMVRKLAVKL